MADIEALARRIKIGDEFEHPFEVVDLGELFSVARYAPGAEWRIACNLSDEFSVAEAADALTALRAATAAAEALTAAALEWSCGAQGRAISEAIAAGHGRGDE